MSMSIYGSKASDSATHDTWSVKDAHDDLSGSLGMYQSIEIVLFLALSLRYHL